MNRTRITALLSLLLLAGLATALWVHRMEIAQPSLTRNLLNADSYRYFYPTAQYLHDELRSGNLPLWSPYQMAGQPFLAIHITGPLYPPGLLLFYLFEPARALASYVVFHLFLAGLFTWLLAGRIGLGGFARISAAATYMLSGPLVVGIYMLPYVSSAAWLPAMLWALTALLREARLRWALVLAFSIVLSFLCGHAQGTLYSVQIAALYGLAGLIFVSKRTQRLRVVAFASVGAVVSFGLAAPQLLPSLELTSQAVRSFEGVPYRQAARPAIRRQALSHGLTRGLTKPPELKPERGPDQRLADFPTVALPLILMAVGLRGRRFQSLFFLAVMFLLWGFLQGRHLPVFGAYYELPGGNLFRAPTRAAFVYQLTGALLLGMGIDALAQWLRRIPGRPGRLLPIGVSAILAAVVIVDDYAHTDLDIRHPAIEGPLPGAPPDLLALLRDEAGYDRTFVQSPSLYTRSLLFKFGMMNGAYVVPDYEPSMPGAYAQLFDVPEQPPWHGRLRVVETGKGKYVIPPEVLDLMSVRYYVAPLESPQMVARMAEALGGDVEWRRGFALVRRPQALPRAYTVHHALMAESAERAARLVRNPFFDPRVQAIVTDPDPSDAVTVTLPPAELATTPPSDDRAVITRYEADRVELEASCAEPCLVVLTDLDYPGWVARVDGEQVPIHPTNAIFRGVELPAGQHHIVYSFESATIRAGAALSGLTLVSLAAGALLHRRRQGAAGAAPVTAVDTDPGSNDPV